MNYFVKPPEETNWRIAPGTFLADLMARWPTAKVQNLPNSETYSHFWAVQMSHDVLEGRFFRDGEGVALDGDIRDCADFALWFRSLVPPEQELWFYDQAYSAHVNLKPGTTATTVEAAFE